VLTTECRKKPQKATQGDRITEMGERRSRRRSSKEAKETLTSKQMANVNPMLLSLLHSTHRNLLLQ
jgi:ABC-type Fe3+-citrate transport system substrate-binding protein